TATSNRWFASSVCGPSDAAPPPRYPVLPVRAGVLRCRSSINSPQRKPEEMMAQSQTNASREAVRNVVPDLINYSEKWLFGEVWERPGLKKRDRSLIVVATLIALGRERQLVGHLNRA